MIGIIIQARMGSSRLPGKVLMDFCGMTLIERIVDRISNSSLKERTVIATTNLKQDDGVEKLCTQIGVECFRGDELNVLKRYYDCALKYEFDEIIRMTGDNPFPDITELERLIDFHLGNRMDYSENHSVLPVGVGMEIISFRALRESMIKATLPRHFEHVNEYILDNIQLFRHGTLDVNEKKRKPQVRLTVDTPEDYDKAIYILKESKERIISTESAIELCKKYEDNINHSMNEEV